MSVFRRKRKEAQLILFFTGLKLLIHLFANSNFGFHRDELLYLALGDHLGWGFKEVPPFIAFISWISTHVFGDSVFATRLLPTLAGAAVVYLTGLIVIALGGKRLAISVACLGLIVSPAFLASQYLLQPVVFDQFFWVLSAYFTVKYIQCRQVYYLYWLGLAIGLGMLTKYTMALYAGGLILGILLTGQRKALFNKHVLGAAVVALIIFLPNILWQINHNLPVITHMKELRETQLEYISPVDFVLEQLLVHVTGVLIWLPGLIYMFFSRVRSKYKFLSAAYLITIFLLILMHGKGYYSFGAYPVLFATGGILWQKALSRLKERISYSILTATLLPALVFIPIAIPILSFNTSLKFFEFTSQKIGISFPLKWEDQKFHATTQDYGDMLGWDEIALNVNKAYTSLSAEQKESTTIFASNYGLAGAIDHLGKPFDLPKAVSLSSSFTLWAPDSIDHEYLIYVDSDINDIGKAYGTAVKIGEISNPFAREKGTGVYLLSKPLANINPRYRKELLERR